MEFLMGVAMAPVIYWVAFLVLLVLAGVGVDSTDSDYFFIPTLSLILLGWIVVAKYDITITVTMAVAAFVAYFAIGAVWSVIRWYRHCLYVREKYLKVLHSSRFYTENEVFPHYLKGDLADGKTVNEQTRENELFFGELADAGVVRRHRNTEPTRDKIIDAVTPVAANRKLAVTRWIIFWPWSIFVFIFDDQLRRLCSWIVDRIGGILKRISVNTFVDLK